MASAVQLLPSYRSRYLWLDRERGRVADAGRGWPMTASPNGRPIRGPGPAKAEADTGREAKRLAAAILEVLAGLRTPAQAASLVNVSLPRYYQLEARAVAGLVRACEPQPKGRRRGPLNELAALTKENERLRRDLGRQQSLVRLAQRSVGLSPPPS